MNHAEKTSLEVHAIPFGNGSIRIVIIDGHAWFAAQDVLALHGRKLSAGALDQLPITDLLMRSIASPDRKPYPLRLVSAKGAIALNAQYSSRDSKAFTTWIKQELSAFVASLTKREARVADTEVWDALCALSGTVSAMATAHQHLVEVMSRRMRGAALAD